MEPWTSLGSPEVDPETRTGVQMIYLGVLAGEINKGQGKAKHGRGKGKQWYDVRQSSLERRTNLTWQGN